MGQQQLLLLLLSVVVVGLAVVGGLFLFEENVRKTNTDALVSDAIQVANKAQAWKILPAAFGGQTGDARIDAADFTGFTFEALSLQDPYVTAHGSFRFRANEQGLVIIGTNESLGTRVTLTVNGTTDSDIVAVVSSYVETTTVSESLDTP